MATISIFVCITNPKKYQYAYMEAINCYRALADEVIIIDGGSTDGSVEEITALKDPKIKIIDMEWPEQWKWGELPRHLNCGLEHCTKDWCIRMDIDYFIHEDDFDKIRETLEIYKQIKIPVAYFVKYNVMNKKQGYQKAVLPLCINSQFKDIIKFGRTTDEKTDWCYPMYVRGKDRDNKVLTGVTVAKSTMMPLMKCNMYNYDYFFRTKEMAQSEYWRFSQAYATAFDWSWGKNDKEAFAIFASQMKGRLGTSILKDVESHPKFIKERIEKMTPDMFGYDNWSGFKNI